MPNPLRELFFGNGSSGLVDVHVPQRTFEDVILPEKTRRALDDALVQIEKHDVLYHRWGLAERHSSGLGLAFNFAGPPGTGKTICAEAVAHALGRRLLVARYAELESMWVGNTGKNVEAIFRQAEQEDAVLFFDEADAIAGRRFTGVDEGYQREANAVVNVMLRELEQFNGVVIFATNLAANLDPAFERRIRTHVRFVRPNAAEREAIWRVQLHERKTPLAEDVDFKALADKYEATGGDIKNAVLKAAQKAVAGPGPDHKKRIHQRHFEEGIREVLDAQDVMSQSLFASDAGAPGGLATAWQHFTDAQEAIQSDLTRLEEQAVETKDHQQAVTSRLDALEDTLAQIKATEAEHQRRIQWHQYLIAGLLLLVVLTAALTFL